jgi:hypothetical protein
VRLWAGDVVAAACTTADQYCVGGWASGLGVAKTEVGHSAAAVRDRDCRDRPLKTGL